MMAAAQMLRHGHISVNGKKVNVPGYLVKVGDVVSISKTGFGSTAYATAQSRHPLDSVPANYDLKVEGELPTATMTAEPLREDMPFQIDVQLVTDFYSKTK